MAGETARSQKYSPVVFDSILSENFPKVDLYVKHEKGFTLYKPQDTELTEENLERLRESGTEFVYIGNADWELVEEYIEKNLENIFSSETVPQKSKNLISSHVIIDCINNVFNNPKMATAFHKCRTILKRLAFKFEDREDLISHFSKLERNYEKYLVIHTAQVTILSMFLHEKLFSPGPKEVIEVGVGAMLHDIGMLQISSNITDKTDALSESEYHRVKFHPKYGNDMLFEVFMTERIPLDIVLSHHERHDGSGYPKGLGGQGIPRHAMLVSICDIYCALTMNRPYRRASSPEEALKTLHSERKYFNPAIFDGFFGIMTEPHTEKVTEVKIVTKEVATSRSASLQDFTRRLRSSGEDRNKLLQLHSEATDSINGAFGEEKEALLAFRKELRDFLQSMSSADKLN